MKSAVIVSCVVLAVYAPNLEHGSHILSFGP